MKKIQNLPKGVIFGSFKKLFKQFEQKFFDTREIDYDANSDGFLLFVSAKTKLSKPIHIACLCDESYINSRNLIIMEAESSAELLITYQNIINSHEEALDVTEVALNKSATLEMLFFQKTKNLNSEINVRQAENSRMKTHYIISGSEKVRNNMNVKLSGVNAEHSVYGLSLTKQSEHVENNIQIVHASPECQSNQLFKQILSDTSTGVFTGRIIVNKDSQKTTAYQRSSNILLNPKAKMNIRPQLEIYADDVKCSHGATVGQLDAEALFYLRSRGIGEDEAKRILLQAFASEIIDNISGKKLKNDILELLRATGH